MNARKPAEQTETNATSVLKFFAACYRAITTGQLITREGRTDKEFHFQNWVKARLGTIGFHFEAGGRNSYPDFCIVELTEGYEVKGLAYPGRESTYDCNSQAPSGYHNGRHIFYVFGRYPLEPDGNSYPVLDLVICHGDFLNADRDYVHKNKHVKGFGSYGDIMIRDRKMYVAPTPFGLLNGVAHQVTLILPNGFPVPGDFVNVGTLVRTEAKEVLVGYTFNLKNNTISPKKVANPHSGREHKFHAYRLKSQPQDKVTIKEEEPKAK